LKGRPLGFSDNFHLQLDRREIVPFAESSCLNFRPTSHAIRQEDGNPSFSSSNAAMWWCMTPPGHSIPTSGGLFESPFVPRFRNGKRIPDRKGQPVPSEREIHSFRGFGFDAHGDGYGVSRTQDRALRRGRDAHAAEEGEGGELWIACEGKARG